MAKQVQPITEYQLDLITRAHGDTGGLIEPLLDLKGGAKLRMIASLAQRTLIEQRGGQWRLTPTAIAIIQGEVQPEAVLPPMGTTGVAAPPRVDDPELEAAVATAEARWQQDQPAVTPESPKRGRENSKQALVIEMLKRPEGATIAQICEATAWQAHTTRGFFAGTVKKKLGLSIASEKIEGTVGKSGASQRIYRIVEEAAA